MESQESRILFEDAGTNTRAQALNIVSSLILNTNSSTFFIPAFRHHSPCRRIQIQYPHPDHYLT